MYAADRYCLSQIKEQVHLSVKYATIITVKNNTQLSHSWPHQERQGQILNYNSLWIFSLFNENIAT